MHPFKTKNSLELDFSEYPQSTHGDVIIEKISSLPKDFNELPKVEDDCLAHGEVTGHSHKLFKMMDPELPLGSSFDIRICKDGTRFLHIKSRSELRHQEHDPRIVPNGDFKITIQREYDPFGKIIRRIKD